jgi:ribosomal protein L7/L12
MFAVLDLADFGIIAAIVIVFAGGAAATVALRQTDRDRIERLEHKLDLILTHLGLDYVQPPKAHWKQLADDPVQKIAAIKAYREEHGVRLAEAKEAVEDYIAGRK